MFPQCHHHTAFKAASQKGPLRQREWAKHALLLCGPQQSRWSMRGLLHLPARRVRAHCGEGWAQEEAACGPGCHAGSLQFPLFLLRALPC